MRGCGEYVYHSKGKPMKDAAGEISLPREEIVRCRDCKYMFDWAYDRMLCKMWADGGMDDDAKNVLYPTVEPDGFCAWGKRREDA
jgi:hypothetical protein